MALIKCNECGKEISDKANTCPNCGYRKPLKKMTKLDKIFVPIISILIVAGIIGLMFTPVLVKSSYPNREIKKFSNGESEYIYEKVPGSNIGRQKINPNYRSYYTHDLGEVEKDYSSAIIVGILSILVPTTTIIIYARLKKNEIKKEYHNEKEF